MFGGCLVAVWWLCLYSLVVIWWFLGVCCSCFVLLSGGLEVVWRLFSNCVVIVW